MVREVLVFAGLPDPGETRMALQTAADRDATAMGDIICGMAQLDPTRRGLTAAEIVKRLREDNVDVRIDPMRAAVEELCGKLDGRALAFKFRSFKRRNFNGQFLDIGGSAHGTNRWVVLPADASDRGKDTHHPNLHHPSLDESGDGGDGGHVLSESSDTFAPDHLASNESESPFGGAASAGPYRERI